MCLLAAGTAEAKFSGVPWVELEVDGKKYDVPVVNFKVEQKLYFVKKALRGDKEAREMLLGDKDEYVMFIGDGNKVRWLYINDNDEWVKEL